MVFGYELPQVVLSLIYFVAVMIAILLLALYLVWWERKVSAHIQVRFGPMMTGKWHGWSQTFADALKLLQKEDIVPGNADTRVYFWAPVMVFTACVMTFVVIPWSPKLIPADLNIGILYILAITTFTIISLLMAGWGSNNKYALLGGMRSAAQIVSYEVPLTLSIMGVVILAQSLSMQDIVLDQDKFWKWGIIRQPLGFLIYLVAATAEVNRTPFDLPEAEQELVSGFNIEYSGMKFAMFFLAEFVNMFVVAAIATTLFLGGWWGPFATESLGWLWFLLKSMAVVFVLMWFRWTYPRLRVDHLMEFAWKWLLPLAFLNLLVTCLIYNLVTL